MNEISPSQLVLEPRDAVSGVSAVTLHGLAVAWVRYDPDREDYRFLGDGRLERLYDSHLRGPMLTAEDVQRTVAETIAENRPFFVGWFARARVERAKPMEQNRPMVGNRSGTVMQQALRTAAPHDILQAWQDGRIGYIEAMELTASESLFELYQACRSSAVELRKDYTPHELGVVERVVADLTR